MLSVSMNFSLSRPYSCHGLKPLNTGALIRHPTAIPGKQHDDDVMLPLPPVTRSAVVLKDLWSPGGRVSEAGVKSASAFRRTTDRHVLKEHVPRVTV